MPNTNRVLTHDELTTVLPTILKEAGIRGYSGDCGEAAKAINNVFFRGEGDLAFGVNGNIMHGDVPYIGHVACRPPRYRDTDLEDMLWDCTGRVKKEDLKGWGILDPIQYAENGYLTEEECQKAEIVYFNPDEERWTNTLCFEVSSEEKEEKLYEAMSKVL